MTAIIDYDAGNLKSVEKALQALGEETVITRDREEILAADRVILPGVGAFGDAMEKLHQYGLVEIIRQVVQKGTPFLGICLGLQLLFEESEESQDVPGLGILKGKIRRIPNTPGLKIPHMGWNSLTLRPETRLFSGLGEEPYVYLFCPFLLSGSCRSGDCGGFCRLRRCDSCSSRNGKCICLPVPS